MIARTFTVDLKQFACLNLGLHIYFSLGILFSYFEFLYTQLEQWQDIFMDLLCVCVHVCLCVSFTLSMLLFFSLSVYRYVCIYIKEKEKSFATFHFSFLMEILCIHLII